MCVCVVRVISYVSSCYDYIVIFFLLYYNRFHFLCTEFLCINNPFFVYCVSNIFNFFVVSARKSPPTKKSFFEHGSSFFVCFRLVKECALPSFTKSVEQIVHHVFFSFFFRESREKRQNEELRDYRDPRAKSESAAIEERKGRRVIWVCRVTPPIT